MNRKNSEMISFGSKFAYRFITVSDPPVFQAEHFLGLFSVFLKS